MTVALQYKGAVATNDVEGRTVTGICSVFGNVDLGGDVVQAGAFKATIKNKSGQFKFLWQHDTNQPPIATILEVKEVGRADLPLKLFKVAPDATGGLQVTRRYLNTPRADEVLQAIKEGAQTGMSFGYDVKDFSFGVVAGENVRLLKQVDLWEISDVVFGMNPAALSEKGMASRSTNQRLRARLEMAKLEVLLWDNGYRG